MKTAPLDPQFAQALSQAYQAAPCQVLPNALWKTLARLEKRDSVLAQSLGGQPIHLELWRDRRLLLYWDRERSQMDLTPEQIEQVQFALVHQDYLPCLHPERFDQRTAFFRLLWRAKQPPQTVSLPPAFFFRGAAPELEAAQISDLIGRCYEDLNPSEEEVRSWMRQPVYSSSLWVWVWDAAREQPAGLGIAELDETIGEGSLEWIQVLPEYSGRGIGQALVLELLRRLLERAEFVTVSGEVDNPTAPERLYRHCGFSGTDVWWVLSQVDPAVHREAPS